MILAGIIPGILAASYTCLGLAQSLGLLAAILSAGVLVLDRKRILLLAAAYTVGLLLASIHLTSADQSRAAMEEAARRGMAFELVATDTRLVADAPDWLGLPLMIRMKIVRPASAAGAVAMVRPPREFRDLGDKVSIGELWRVQAEVEPIRGGISGFDSVAFLRAEDAAACLKASTMERLGQESFPWSFFAWIFKLRDQILLDLCSGLDSDSARNFMAGVFFGCSQGIEQPVKESFVRTGTVHILSISGLHVGVIALIAGLCLRWAPYSARHWALPLFILAYVLLVGARPPAVRSFAMIAVWCAGRALLLPFRPINSVALAAVIILLVSPMALFDIGFQFSFVVVAYLTLAWEETSAWAGMPGWRTPLIPADRRTPARMAPARAARWTLGMLACSVVAFLGGLGFCLWQYGWFTPFSVIINMAIIPTMFPLFVLAFLKSCAGVLCLPTGLLDFSINGILQFVFIAVDIGGAMAPAERWPRPGIVSMFLFHAVLLTFVLAPSFRASALSAGGLAVIVGWWWWLKTTATAALVIASGAGEGTPSVALVRPGGGSAIIVDAPWEGAAVLTEGLRRMGVGEIELFWATHTGTDSLSGFSRLTREFSLDTVVLPSRSGHGKSYLNTMEAIRAKSCGLVRLRDGCAQVSMTRLEERRDTGGWTLSFPVGDATARLSVSTSPGGGEIVTLLKDSEKVAEISLTPSSEASLRVIPLHNFFDF